MKKDSLSQADFTGKAGEAGFSLIELSAIITIAAIILAGYLSWTIPATQSNAVKTLETNRKIRTIATAIGTFVATNRRLPCPANPTLNSSSHVNSNTDAINQYDFDDEALTVSNTEATSCPISLGAVPTRALGLPSEQMFDGWGRKIFYQVAKDLCGSKCTTSSYKKGISSGGITVSTTSDNTVVLADNSAAYILISYGANGFGAYLPSGRQIPTAGSSVDEITNNTNSYTSDNANVAYVKTSSQTSFDDILLFREITQVNSLADVISPADFKTCVDNSDLIEAIDQTVATSLKTDVTALEVTDSATNIIYNTGDTAILEILWDLQEACLALYSNANYMDYKCPAGMSYNKYTNACT